MNAGLPGAGIGGLFYLFCALIMPFKEIYLTLTKPKHKFRYRLIATQLSITTGIVAGFILIYILVSNISGVELSLSMPLVSSESVFYSLMPVVINVGLLLVTLILVRLAAFLSKPEKPPIER